MGIVIAAVLVGLIVIVGLTAMASSINIVQQGQVGVVRFVSRCADHSGRRCRR